MKRLLSILIFAFLSVSVFAQSPDNMVYIEAADLKIIGKLFPDAPEAYRKIDLTKYDDFNEKEQNLLKQAAGLAVVFKTDSPCIAIMYHMINDVSDRTGFDLYIKDDAVWKWAGIARPMQSDKQTTIVENMDGTMHECLLYLPLRTTLESVKIGVKEGSTIEAMPNPFNHRIAVHGSSFTHGVGTTRSGLSYSNILQRKTGLDIINTPVSGNCRMQPQFARVFADAEYELLLIDAFSNGDPGTMRDNLFNFIETIRASKPHIPIVFQRTIYRERRNFDLAHQKKEEDKLTCADSLMTIVLNKYDDIYYIQADATTPDHESSYDGVHPSENGYFMWAESVYRQLLPILHRYRIGGDNTNRIISFNDVQRAKKLISVMTLEEKCKMLSGDWNKTLMTQSIDRLSIPAIRLSDGPQGVRDIIDTFSTFYPCALAMAASWNREATKKVGEGIGIDAKARKVKIMLAPAVNIYRNPLCGRNFEYMGEDPYLASETALNYINGIQSNGVMATIKHFAANNSEYSRHIIDDKVDERTLNEIYFPAFRKAVENGVACVMTSYNYVNGVHASENSWLINDNLRKWGFNGIVMSDWTSVYSTMGALTSGLDIEMPRAYFLNYDVIKPLVDNGVIEERVIDEKCIHILSSYSAYGFLDRELEDEIAIKNDSRCNSAAYDMALESPVLLKNNGILPLRKGKIAVVGPSSDKMFFGSGSGACTPYEENLITLREGLSSNKKLSVNNGMADAESINKSSAVVVCVGFGKELEGECDDRPYSLPSEQLEIIDNAIHSNRNVIVVINAGGEIDITPFADKVSAIIMGWYGGQAGGAAMADLLTGKVSPSGKLPFTFWGSLEKNPTMEHYYPFDYVKKYPKYGPRAKDSRAVTHYSEYYEGLFVGYRAEEHFDIKPMYPFGYGLTYTTFEYSNLNVQSLGEDGFNVSFTVKNTGKYDASEVAQLYVSPKSPSTIRPASELKGYDKKFIRKGESVVYSIYLPKKAFAYYDSTLHDWKVEGGEYGICIGASYVDIKLENTITLK